LLQALARDGVDVEMIAILWFGTTYSAVLAKLAELAASGVTVNIVKRRANRGPLGHHLSFVRAWAEVRRLLRARRNRIQRVRRENEPHRR